MSHDEPRDPQDWARLLEANWQARAESAHRNFYVASLPGWKDPCAWEANARLGADVVTSGIPAEGLARAHALEIGCGIGRLAEPLAPRVASDTGVYIAEAWYARRVPTAVTARTRASS